MNFSFRTGDVGRACLADPLDMTALPAARRRARTALVVLWLGWALGFALMPSDAALAGAVLVAGISTILESAHGALAFDRATASFRRGRTAT